MSTFSWDPADVAAVGTLGGLVARAAAQAPDDTFLIESEAEDITFGDLEICVRGISEYLERRGVRPGGRVMTILPNSSLAALLFIGVAAAGRTLVPVNPASSWAEIEHMAQRTGASLAIVEASLRNKCAPLTCATHFVAEPRTMVDWMFELGRNAAHRNATIDPESPAEIVFTSGSSGRPKGVVLSHRALLSNSHALGAAYDVREGSRFLTVCPLFHNSGQVFSTLTALWACGPTVVARPALALHRFWKLVDDHRPDWTLVMNAFLASALRSPAAANPHHRMVGILAGGSPLIGNLFHEFEDRFGTPVYHVYGLTETTSVASGQRPGKQAGDRSVGTGLGNCLLRIRGEAGEGEIEISGSNLFTRYLNDRRLTKQRTEDGWLQTGDLGRLDSQGNLHVVDRIDNMMIVGGENMYPGEVEHVAAKLSGIPEVMVVAVPDQLLGRAPVLVYSCAPNDAPTAAEWRSMLLPELTGFKVPKKFVALVELGLEDFPRAHNNKILRGELQQAVAEYLGATAPSWRRRGPVFAEGGLS